jgi:hypothetical protein
MTRWSATTRTRRSCSALAYGSRSTAAAKKHLNRLVHHQRGRYFKDGSDERLNPRLTPGSAYEAKLRC